MEQGHKVAGGDVLGKTIIFAANQRHAEFIQQRFDVGWPEHAGRTARVITHATEHAGRLIEDFTDPDSPLRVAISINMRR